MVQEVKTTMRNLQSTLKTDVKHLSDDEVKERKSGLLKLIERMENLSKMFHNMLECSKSVAKDKVCEIMADYSIVIRNGKIVWKHGPNGPFFLYNLSSQNY